MHFARTHALAHRRNSHKRGGGGVRVVSYLRLVGGCLLRWWVGGRWVRGLLDVVMRKLMAQGRRGRVRVQAKGTPTRARRSSQVWPKRPACSSSGGGSSSCSPRFAKCNQHWYHWCGMPRSVIDSRSAKQRLRAFSFLVLCVGVCGAGFFAEVIPALKCILLFNFGFFRLSTLPNENAPVPRGTLCQRRCRC